MVLILRVMKILWIVLQTPRWLQQLQDAVDFQDDWQEMSKPRNKDSYMDPPALYDNRIKIQESKFKHLQELKTVIPESHMPSFYDNLKH